MKSLEKIENNVFEVIYGSKNTTLKLGENLEIPCYVIKNSSGEVLRVFSGRGLQSALGFFLTKSV